MFKTRASMLHLCLSIAGLVTPILLTGCISDRIHQPIVAMQSTYAPATPELRLDTTATKAQQIVDRIADNNHATVEFEKHGFRADDCSKAHADGTLCQRDFAVRYIQTARKQIADEGGDKEVVVIAFIHGNENNASETVDNYPHFRQIINCLNLGTDAYYKKYGPPASTKYYDAHRNPLHDELICGGRTSHGDFSPDNAIQQTNIRFVGIYLAWRGRTNKSALNVREGAARRISINSAMVETLYQLRDAAKDNSAKAPARFVVIGHSFGGLLLQQAAIKIFEDAYKDSNDRAFGNCDVRTEPRRGLRPFTDMMITINEAINSVSAQQLIEEFQALDGSFCNSETTSPSLHRPLLVSFASKSDFWSVGFGSPLRHVFGPDSGGAKKIKNLDGVQQSPPSRFQVNWAIPPVLSFFQNLCYLQKGFDPGERACDSQKNEYTSTAGLAIREEQRGPDMSDTEEVPNPIAHLYVRFDCKLPKSIDETDHRNFCATPDPQEHPGDLHIWNRTPYWIGAIDRNIINGHTDFWNARFIKLLEDLTGAFSTLNANDVLESPYPKAP